MVLDTNLNEVIWTSGNDAPASSPLTIDYGLAGNDSFANPPVNGFHIIAGGSGSDQYIAKTIPFASFAIETGNSSGDLASSAGPLVAPGVSLFTIDGRHFGSIDKNTQQEIYLINFAKPENQIETITTSQGTLSFSEFAALAPTLPNFIGNLTWETVIGLSSYLTGAGLTSTAKINEVIDFVTQRAASLEATDGADVLIGTPGNETLDGLGGNDRILGLESNDTLIGGGGKDFLDGGKGKDQLSGGGGNDTLVGGDQNDVLKGQGGSDIFALQKGPGQDKIIDFHGSDKLGLTLGLSFNKLTIIDQSSNTLIKAGGDVLAVLNSVDSNTITRSDFVNVRF